VGRDRPAASGGAVDILLVSPERLANQDFRTSILPSIPQGIGLFVVTRPIASRTGGTISAPTTAELLTFWERFPQCAVLATTATANNRVVEDVTAQLGTGVGVVRGPLVRESLKATEHNDAKPGCTYGLAGGQQFPVYQVVASSTLSRQRDAERVSLWLRHNDINAEAYHADIDNPEDGSSAKRGT